MAQPDYRKFEKALRKLDSLPDHEYNRVLDQLRRLVEQAEAFTKQSESPQEK